MNVVVPGAVLESSYPPVNQHFVRAKRVPERFVEDLCDGVYTTLQDFLPGHFRVEVRIKLREGRGSRSRIRVI